MTLRLVSNSTGHGPTNRLRLQPLGNLFAACAYSAQARPGPAWKIAQTSRSSCRPRDSAQIRGLRGSWSTWNSTRPPSSDESPELPRPHTVLRRGLSRPRGPDDLEPASAGNYITTSSRIRAFSSHPSKLALTLASDRYLVWSCMVCLWRHFCAWPRSLHCPRWTPDHTCG